MKIEKHISAEENITRKKGSKKKKVKSKTNVKHNETVGWTTNDLPQTLLSMF